jgi:hypothetical protein
MPPRYVHFAPHPAVPLYHPEMHFLHPRHLPAYSGNPSTVGNLPIFHVALGVERFPQQLDVQSDMLQHPPFCPPPSRERNPLQNAQFSRERTTLRWFLSTPCSTPRCILYLPWWLFCVLRVDQLGWQVGVPGGAITPSEYDLAWRSPEPAVCNQMLLVSPDMKPPKSLSRVPCLIATCPQIYSA